MKRLLASACVVLLSGSLAFGLFPQSAHAELPVIDVSDILQNTISAVKDTITAGATQGLATKELALDPIAWAVSKMAIQSMTKSVVNWINSGFNGSPAFVTDLQGHLQAVADSVAGPFIGQLGSASSLHSPFQSIVANAIGKNYYLSTSKDSFFTQSAYTLNKVTPNDAAFLAGDFSKGGISAFFSAVANPQNNPYGAQMIADQELARRVGAAQNTALTQLNWGQGFLSWCGSDRSGTNSNANAGGTSSGGVESVTVTSQVNPAEVCQNKDGTPGYIQTPGSVIQSQINKTLGLSGDQLVSADEFNEIIGALMSQLVSQVVGATGLSGVASGSSGGSGYIDQAANSTQYTSQLNTSGSQATLAQNITSEEAQMTQYKNSWQTIETEAQAAASKVTGCTLVSDTLTKANTQVGRADATTASLQKILAELTASGATGTPTIDSMNAEFTALLASAETPSATDIAYATNQSQDNSGTLFDQMKQIASTGICVAL